MSDAVLVTLIIVVGLIVLATIVVMARVIMALSEGLDASNERSSNHLRALTSTFAEGCMAISEPNQQVILRRLEVERPIPDTSRPPVYPNEQQIHDINAVIAAGPPNHGGDPSY